MNEVVTQNRGDLERLEELEGIIRENLAAANKVFEALEKTGDMDLSRFISVERENEIEKAIIINPMTKQEARECADRINTNINNVRALVWELHERRGWDALGYKNWTECVRKEFEQAERYIFYQFKAAQIEQNIADCTRVQLGEIPEKHLRPLGKLPAEDQAAAWHKAKETAPNGEVTGPHVEKTVKEFITEKKELTTEREIETTTTANKEKDVKTPAEKNRPRIPDPDVIDPEFQAAMNAVFVAIENIHGNGWITMTKEKAHRLLISAASTIM
jgi:hypothetical protein